MTSLDLVIVFLGGLAAGTINTVVGSGTLISFPVLLAVGYPPIVANVSNTIGLVPGSLAGSWGYRRELAGQWRRIARLTVASVSGGIVGAVLLLVLPAAAFKAIVPAFIVVALVLVLCQPHISRMLAARGLEAAGFLPVALEAKMRELGANGVACMPLIKLGERAMQHGLADNQLADKVHNRINPAGVDAEQTFCNGRNR